MRNLILFTSLCICTAMANFGQSIPQQSSRPNIVIVLADDMGFSDLGATGSEISTPHLDRLAQNGILFTDMQNASKCFPSRAMLLTGLYAQRNNMSQRPQDIHNAVTFGKVLKDVGYRTLFIGKHHGTDNPYYWGFDHYWGLRDGAANYFNPGLQRVSDKGPPAQKEGMFPRTFAFDGKLVAPFTPPEDYYSTDTWTDWAIQLLDRYKDEEKPFCLYIAYQAPHDPLQAPEETIKKYEGKYDVGYEVIAKNRYEKQRKKGLLDDRYPRSRPTYPSWESLSDSTRTDQIRRMQVYAAMIDRLDQNIGRVIGKIKDEGKWENTLFLFMSDNGASAEVVQIGEGPIGSLTRWSSLKKDWANVANTPFRYYKNYSYAGGTNTPLIVHWPNQIKQGGQIDHTPLHFVDLMPTLIDITGARYPAEYKNEQVHPMDGVSLLPLLQGDKLERKKPLYFNWGSGSAIRTDDWKLVRNDTTWQLFDMRRDRTETHDLAEERPDIFEMLRLNWEKWARSVGVKGY